MKSFATSIASRFADEAPQEGDDQLGMRLGKGRVDRERIGAVGDLEHRVRIPVQALFTGHAGEVEVAAIFSMHPRTLSRRLAAAGTSFRQLVDECSFEIARHLLEFSRQDVAQITAALDYADPSAFTRAFRRWSGTTPACWRASRTR